MTFGLLVVVGIAMGGMTMIMQFAGLFEIMLLAGNTEKRSSGNQQENSFHRRAT